MSRLAPLKAATSLGDVAKLLGFKPKSVSYILYKQPEQMKYSTFQIPKRNGGQRTINAPLDALKLLQRRLADLLQDCIDEINAANQRKDRTAHGFRRKRSIITNARLHRHRRWVFNLDLEDFFPSINFGRVRGFLIKNRDFALNEHIATVLAQIACHGNSLPQGSPCSPVISNLVAHPLDMRLVTLATRVGCTYSRYADDLTFSTNKKEFPTEIAAPQGKDGVANHMWLPGEPLRKVIERSGFRINATKTHLMYRDSRQVVTGLVVNEKISVRSEYRRNVRAMVHSLVKTGAFEILGAAQKDGKSVLEKRAGKLDELHGMLGFIDSIVVGTSSQESESKFGAMSAMEKTYRDFLMYSLFFAAQTPVLLCEGESDNIYLTHAIRSLAVEFPDLAEVTLGNKIRLKVRLYKYPRSSTARLLGLRSGGYGGLSGFIGTYNNATSGFAQSGQMNPVVVLYDNDSGANGIRSAIKAVSGLRPTGAEPFVHVTKNLYAVPTPLGKDGIPTEIEDLFDATIKATVLEGKTFNSAKNFDHEKHFGKTVFAHKVVRRRAKSIDFSGFRPLLENLVAAIKEHSSAVNPKTPAA